MVTKVFMRTVATVREQVVLYKVVVQMVLLYGNDRWVVTGAMLKVLEVFHYRVARRITGNMVSVGMAPSG